VTPRRFSYVRNNIGYLLPSNVTATAVTSIAQTSLSRHLGVVQSVIIIDSVTSGRRLAKWSGRRTLSVLYDVDFRVEVPGTDTADVEQALILVANDSSNYSASVEAILEEVTGQAYDLADFQVNYVGQPVVELWMYTTATQTSTISSTSDSSTWSDSSTTSSSTTTRKICFENSVPYMLDVADSSSCIGIFSGESCSPACVSGYTLVAPINCTDTSDPDDTFGEFTYNPLVCVAAPYVQSLDSAEVLLVEAALVGNETDLNFSAKGEQAAIISAFSTVLSLSTGQVYLVTAAVLNSDSESSIPSRRLSAEQGLWMKVMLQMYPANSATALVASLASLNADGGPFTEALIAALGDADITVPTGLANATLHVGTPELSTAIVPVARWEAQTAWSECSTDCGVGQRTRLVECLTGIVDLCNANAPPDYTMETYEPNTEKCQKYTNCPYDWTCPSGPDVSTGEGCETQASFVVGAMVVAFFIVTCIVLRCLRNLHAKQARTSEPNKKGSREKSDEGTRQHPTDDRRIDIEWTREDGVLVNSGRRRPPAPGAPSPEPSPRRSARSRGSHDIEWTKEDESTDDRARRTPRSLSNGRAPQSARHGSRSSPRSSPRLNFAV